MSDPISIKDSTGKELVRIGINETNEGPLPINNRVSSAEIVLREQYQQVSGLPDHPTLGYVTSDRIHLDARSAEVTIGGSDQGGTVIVLALTSLKTIELDGKTGQITLLGHVEPTSVILHPTEPLPPLINLPRILLDPQHATIQAGGNDVSGRVLLYPQWAKGGDVGKPEMASVHLEGGGGNLRLGGNTTAGDIALFPRLANSADVNDTSKATIRLLGENGDIELKGDIRLQNADCAEDFSLAQEADITPGTVLVIDDDGLLQTSAQPYDRRVAGVISGAGNLRPGIVLGRTPSTETKAPVALAGRVYCKVDAGYGPIGVGDLLTTSPTMGHAMRASDPLQAFGAVIGKALRPQREGCGLIPILVALQ
jgi:hypothetical protein